MTSTQRRLAKLEERAFSREMDQLRDDYHRITSTREDIRPLINTLIHRCIDRGIVAPFPSWFYRLRADTATPEQLAYCDRRMREAVGLLKPWIHGKGTL